MESQSQAIREPAEGYDRYTSSIRQRSDGELRVVLKRLCSLHRFSALPTGCRRRVGGTNQQWWATPLCSFRCILMSEYTNVRSRRLLERLFLRSRPNCSTARRSRRRPSLTSSGRLLHYIQVRLTTHQTDEVSHMLTERVCCPLAPFLVPLGGADTVRLFRLASRVHDQ